MAASTHWDGWSQEGHPEGCFSVCISKTTPDRELAYGMLCIRGSILVSKLKFPDLLSCPCSCVLQARHCSGSMQEVSLASAQTEIKCYKLCWLPRAIPTSHTSSGTKSFL